MLVSYYSAYFETVLDFDTKTSNIVLKDASVKSSLPLRFWSVGSAFAGFFGLLAIASKMNSEQEY